MKRKLSKGLVLGKRSIAVLSNDAMSGIAGGSVYSSGCGGSGSSPGTIGCPSAGCTANCPSAYCGSGQAYSCHC